MLYFLFLFCFVFSWWSEGMLSSWTYCGFKNLRPVQRERERERECVCVCVCVCMYVCARARYGGACLLYKCICVSERDAHMCYINAYVCVHVCASLMLYNNDAEFPCVRFSLSNDFYKTTTNNSSYLLSIQCAKHCLSTLHTLISHRSPVTRLCLELFCKWGT